MPRMHVCLEKDARTPRDKYLPRSPISCICTAILFHLNLFNSIKTPGGIVLQRTHTRARTHTTFTFGRRPRLEDAAQKGD